MRAFILNFFLLSAIGYVCLIAAPAIPAHAASTKDSVKALAAQQQALTQAQQALNHGQQTLNHKQQTLANGQQTLASGQQALVSQQQELTTGQQTLTYEQQVMINKTEALARREDWIKSAIPPTIAALGALFLSVLNRQHIQSLNVNVNGRVTRLIELEVAAAKAGWIEEGRKLATEKEPDNPKSV